MASAALGVVSVDDIDIVARVRVCAAELTPRALKTLITRSVLYFLFLSKKVECRRKTNTGESEGGLGWVHHRPVGKTGALFGALFRGCDESLDEESIFSFSKNRKDKQQKSLLFYHRSTHTRHGPKHLTTTTTTTTTTHCRLLPGGRVRANKGEEREEQ